MAKPNDPDPPIAWQRRLAMGVRKRPTVLQKAVGRPFKFSKPTPIRSVRDGRRCKVEFQEAFVRSADAYPAARA